MSEFTAAELEKAINSYLEEGNTISSLDEWDFWVNYGCNSACSEPFELPGFGKIESFEWQGMHEEIAGEYNGDYSAWKIHTIIRVGNRYFGKFGEEDSWGGSDGLGPLEEVEKITKTINVWEKKYDY